MKKIIILGIVSLSTSIVVLGGCGGSATIGNISETTETTTMTESMVEKSNKEIIINDFLENFVKEAYSTEMNVSSCDCYYDAKDNSIATYATGGRYDEYYGFKNLNFKESDKENWDKILNTEIQTQKDLIDVLNRKLSENGENGEDITYTFGAVSTDGELVLNIKNGELEYDCVYGLLNYAMGITEPESSKVFSKLQSFFISLKKGETFEEVKKEAEKQGYYVKTDGNIGFSQMWISPNETTGMGAGAETWYRYDTDSIRLFFDNDDKLSSKAYRFQNDSITVSYSFYDDKIEIENRISGEQGTGNLDIPNEDFSSLREAIDYVNANR